jgi:hypothetical protein
MCDYQGYEFGAGSYPDSVCIEGKLYDADNCDNDSNLYDHGEDIPCPICRPDAAIEYWFDQNNTFITDGLTDEENEAEAMRCAVSLVNDIRSNRGELPYIPTQG